MDMLAESLCIDFTIVQLNGEMVASLTGEMIDFGVGMFAKVCIIVVVAEVSALEVAVRS